MRLFSDSDSLPNRTALARGDALFGELNGAPRQLLSDALAALRAAIEAQETRAIEPLRERLNALMDQLRG
jgi:hypothetical protein